MDSETIERISAESVGTWNFETDVLVVGLGCAGASAAVEAAASGVDVLVLERASGGGGTTAAATGHFYLGGGTRPQLANGIDDSVDAMFTYMMANTPVPDEKKIRLYCDGSVDHFDWLVEHGVPFNDGFWRTKHYEQPTDECLIWSGNEKVWPFIEHSKPAPRGHKVEKEGSEGGVIVVDELTRCAAELGARFEYDAGVTNLVVDADGRIVGVAFKRFGEGGFARARRAIVLAAGGFAMNPAMLERYCPRLAHEGVYKQGNPFDDGVGIRLGESAGGRAIHMDGCLVTSPFYPPESLLSGILVNREGKRFVAEDSYHARTASAILEQPGATAYLICDDESFGRPELEMQELIDAWESIEEMEAGLALPAGSLQETLHAHNEHAARGEDPLFHKHPDWLKPIVTAPFAALQCSLGQSGYVGFTLGGLAVNENAEVLDANDAAIPRLFAVGACASNIAQDGAGYSSGTCIGESTFFGRRAGRFSAQLDPID